MNKIYTVLIIGFLFTNNVFGQISYPGTPVFNSVLKSKSSKTVSNDLFNVLELNTDSAKQVNINEDKSNAFVFAHQFIVNYTPENSGTWFNTDCMRVWQIKIVSPKAYSLNLIFDRYVLPRGAKLFLYNPSHTDIKGAFTSDNNKESGILATSPIKGDTIIVEYQEPIDAEFEGELVIGAVNHDFLNVYEKVGDFGDSGSCNQDINCEYDSMLQVVKHSVVRILIDGTYLCTGTLVNNITPQGVPRPYIFSAAHCFKNGLPSNAVFLFNYEMEQCGVPIDGDKTQSISGAEMLCKNPNVDYALMELSEAPPEEYKPYYAGWSISSNPQPTFYCIHHPQGDVKKISKTDSNIEVASLNVEYINVPNAHWHVPEWDLGTTEGGSSGSALLNSNYQVIGALSAGAATCGAPYNDYFVSLPFSWEYDSNVENRPQVYLNQTTTYYESIDGYNPYDSAQVIEYSNIYDTEDANYISTEQLGNTGKSVTEFAERFDDFSSANLKGFYFTPSDVTSGTSQNIEFGLWSSGSDTDIPSVELWDTTFVLNSLSNEVEKFISFGVDMQVEGNFYITCKASSGNVNDILNFYCYSDLSHLKNSMLVRDQNGWSEASEFYSVANTSLAFKIQANMLRTSFDEDIEYTNIGDPIEVVEKENCTASIWPNPTSDMLNINWGDCSIDRIEVYSLNGLLLSVYYPQVYDSTTQIRVQNLHTGMYIIRLTSENSSKSYKFIKK